LNTRFKKQIPHRPNGDAGFYCNANMRINHGAVHSVINAVRKSILETYLGNNVQNALKKVT
jgi:hypothetical protein